MTWRIRTREKILFLTFDDGPVPEATIPALDLLKRFQAKGTFFCVGENIKKHPDLLACISQEGHLAGNHSFSHANGWRVPVQEYLDDVGRCREILAANTPQNDRAAIFRPPYGKLKWSQFLLLKKQYRMVMWDVLSKDWQQERTAESCYQRVIRKAVPGSIIVFHDSIKARERMIPALEKTLQHFSQQGFRFESLAGYI